ncbi:PEP-CTERM sorting domain-containing protein [Steroidobacter sp. S1-65]|uniref:PEP-CTERM sorting domain-containing protein n=1 Tax=Steroidobacter gossypii TaxID=2805490 RepID=A0ABS1WUX9_9GAMM|nr:PEP-CTERM sorting domain-containing protein [Steroidobacter gossypii]MBM0104779.1 PEP-CTERM sorting domain-containing protein [Steroidobacter gossypii]
MKKAFAAGLCLLASFSAHATLITIDPDDYAHGTDLSQIAPGLTLQALHQANTSRDPVPNSFYAPVYLPIVAADCDFRCGNLNGEREFGFLSPSGSVLEGFGRIEGNSWCLSATQAGLGSSYCRDGFTVLEMTFENPTDFLQVETAWGSDASSLMAFNSAGERLFWCTANEQNRVCDGVQIVTSGLGGHSSTFTIARDTGDIARVIFGGFMGSASIGGITYNVPEPGTLALFALGLWGLGLARRRRS